MKIIQIAMICHQLNKNYCESIGDTTQVDWDKAPDWQKTSAINGVRFFLASRCQATPKDSHDSWMKEKLADGWVHGDVKDVAKKQHPCLVPYEDLPQKQQIKDKLFTQTIKVLADLETMRELETT